MRHKALASLICFSILVAASLCLASTALAGQDAANVFKATDYPGYLGISPRMFVWLFAQMHLWFAAFVLAVPIFVVILEAIGMGTKDERYDRAAHEFLRVSLTAYSFTAISGVVLAIGLILFYPALMKYLDRVFRPTFYAYFAVFVVENVLLYAYYYGWERMREGGAKKKHLIIGIMLNVSGTAIMMIANAWVTFMMTPSGLGVGGAFNGDTWAAVNNMLWSPMNLHRFIANISYGGSIVAAYAGFRFLCARSDEERTHYDWMGYVASIIAIASLLPLPFAGYWLTAEIYAFSQQMGITLMGGAFAWLFIVQAVLIGVLFMAANYYLWCGLQRGHGHKRYTPYVKYIAFVLLACFFVWFTPHTPVVKPSEALAMGTQYHKYLAPLGLMPAKNIAVNVMILATFLSFLFYRRSNRVPVVAWANTAKAAQAGVFIAGVANIVFLGVYYGYYTNTAYKVASSIPQVVTTLLVIAVCSVIEYRMHRGARVEGPYMWGRMPGRSQYALFLVAVTFTWIMGLMGYVRSAIRQGWHVYGVVKDASVEAYTPSIASSAIVVSIGTVIFLSIVVFVFWLNIKRRGGRAS